ncbi:hypothetical protein Lalb_Chr16g0382291 [Lupinus albus]|uniref:Uncharacterized protein n=1 Tax=Lupinus albus TaxID=3870 RepID=A0A6A4PAQ1_LUPAL|nr:hypothetical protein Lalb_Chr16g0382291 [Lupinus albus]
MKSTPFSFCFHPFLFIVNYFFIISPSLFFIILLCSSHVNGPFTSLKGML